MKNKNNFILLYTFIIFQVIGIFFSIDYHLNIINLFLIFFVSFIITSIISVILKHIKIPNISFLCDKRITYNSNDIKCYIKYIIIILLLVPCVLNRFALPAISSIPALFVLVYKKS